MADRHQVPPDVDQSAERIQDRAYDEDFARQPDDEIHPVTEPGAGPHGSTGTSGTNGPIVLMAISALIAFSVFLFREPWVLALGIVVFLGAALWAGVVGRSQSSGAGSGPAVIESDDRQAPSGLRR